jgi:hypothetical protein
MFQMLSEMVSPEKFLSLVAFPELVDCCEMLESCFPASRIGKFFAAIATYVCDMGSCRRSVVGLMIV